MTGIFGALKRNPQIPPERCFLPPRVSLLSLLRQRLFTPQQRSGNLSPRLTLGIKCRGQHLTCVCVCSVLSLCLRVLLQT